MFGFKMPFKFMIVKALSGVRAMDSHAVLERLKEDYGQEKQCTLETIEYHLQALKAVGIVTVSDAHIEEDQSIILHYSITKNGKSVLNKSFL